VVSYKNRAVLRDTSGDPWNGHTLEWAMSSPPPFYNFAVIPTVEDLDAWTDMKEKGTAYHRSQPYEDIHMPKNTALGFVMGILAFIFGFAMIWQIWWLALVGAIGLVVSVIVRASDTDVDYYVPAAEVKKIEDVRYRQLADLSTQSSDSSQVFHYQVQP
jgi:cytochrome o ubiquinol oxidase subunit I